MHLIILNNLESINSELIKLGYSSRERLVKLNETARKQMELLVNNNNLEKLEKIKDKN